MLDWSSIIPSALATLTAGGWLLSRHRRQQEKESHDAEMEKAKADVVSAMRESETKYTREALDIYTKQVVEPIREQCERNTVKLARFEEAIEKAPMCRIFPDCVILRELRASQKDDGGATGGNP